MIITKTQAAEMAAKMLEKSYEGINKKRKVLDDFVEKLYLATVPSEVLEFSKKFRSYVNTRGGISLKGTGLNYTWFSFVKSLPSDSTSSSVVISDEDAAYIVKCLDSISDAKNRVEKVEKDLTATILSFRTDKNIREHFPKAAPFLPKEKPAGTVAINVSDIEARLEALNSLQ